MDSFKVSVRLSRDIYNFVRQMSDKTGDSMSKTIRNCLTTSDIVRQTPVKTSDIVRQKEMLSDTIAKVDPAKEANEKWEKERERLKTMTMLEQALESMKDCSYDEVLNASLIYDIPESVIRENWVAKQKS